MTYVAEITTPRLRGILASTSTVSVISGALIQFLLGTFFNWRNVALISCTVPVMSFILCFFVPESPTWLISKGRLEEAQKSIAWLRGWKKVEEINDEFQELHDHLKESNDADNKLTKLEAIKLFSQKKFLWPFSVVSFTFFLGYFTGMSTLQTYAVKIFATLNSPIDKYYATIFLGVAQLAGCLVSVFLIHKVGKRKLNLLSLVGTGVAFLTVATYAFLIDVKYLDTQTPTNVTETFESDLVRNLKTQTWIPITLLIGVAFFCHIGIRLLPWMLIGEVYSPDIRSTASGFSGAVSYFFGFAANKTFLSMVSAITIPGTFWFYGTVGIVGAIVLHFVLPETEGKTLFEITEHFAGRSKMNNKVFKHKKPLTGEVNEAYKPEKYEQFESRL